MDLPKPASKNATVKRTLDLKDPPPLNAAQKARLEAVAAMPDEQIDCSDAPFLPDAVWTKPVVLRSCVQAHKKARDF